MKPELRRFGEKQSPVVVLSDFTGEVAAARALAAGLAPFPSAESSYYPGLRRVLGEADIAANAYVDAVLERAAPYIAGPFNLTGFDLIEASFSIVTTRPDALMPAQQAPHFDSTDPKYIAVLHYLSDTPDTGTAFYRQRSTGIEAVDTGNVDRFIAHAQRESEGVSGYIHGSNNHFEQIGAIESVPDRLVVYQGCLLHSGIIPANMDRSNDPLCGRLTANFFIRAH